MIKEAIAKIDSEFKGFKGGQMEGVMKNRCAEVLKEFCRQEEEFAQAIVQTDRTLSDCLKAITRKYTSKARQDGISDIEAFKTMAQFYFPGAGVHFVLTIDVNANEPAETFEDVKSSAKADPEDDNDDNAIDENDSGTKDSQDGKEQEAPVPAQKKKSSLSFSLDGLF